MKQGEIWDIDLGNTQSANSRELCPVIIINDDTIGIIPSRVIAPLIKWQDKFEDAIWLIRITPNDENNLGIISAADVFQLHTIPISRFIKKIGMLSAIELLHIKNAVKAIINAE
jgi:mRNA interferase MazF